MDNISIPNSETAPQENQTVSATKKIKQPKLLAIMGGLITVLIILAILLVKGYFIAATVNGSPISRLSIISELEKEGGKQVLESLIDKKLIELELNKKGIQVTPVEVEEEIKKIEADLVLQGQTLKSVLAEQGMTEEKLREQITTQKRLEKLLADKIAVSPEEIDAFINDSKTTPPKDVKMEDFRKQVSIQLKQQKFQQEAQKWVADLNKNATIKYFITY